MEKSEVNKYVKMGVLPIDLRSLYEVQAITVVLSKGDNGKVSRVEPYYKQISRIAGNEIFKSL